MKAVTNILQERRLLEEIRHPLCVNLRYAFQDDENLFMTLDLMLGGDLRFHLDRRGPFKEESVRFYLAELACAVRYLHSRDIVHRDLKPENILLDADGHVHLTDFNIATRVTPGKPLKSVAGSMAYMSPEIFSSEGYYTSVDWWSLGIIMHELLTGRRPFRSSTKTDEEFKEAVRKQPLDFTEMRTKFNGECIDVLTGLLERDVTKRLGVNEELYQKYMDQAWFKMEVNQQPPVDFAFIAEKKVAPIFVPDAKQLNFDASHELEELLIEENTLSPGRRGPKRLNPKRLPGGATGPFAAELERLETKFSDFNFERPPQIITPPVEGDGQVPMQMVERPPSSFQDVDCVERRPPSVMSEAGPDPAVALISNKI